MLCVRLFFVSLSFVLTPFSLCRHKMEVNEEPLTPERRQGIRVGDTVHVYSGTSSGTRAYRQMAYIGTVVVYDELAMKWLVCVVFYLVLSCLVFLFCHLSFVLSCLGLQHYVA